VNWTSHGDWRRGSAVVQGHTRVHPWVVWLKWRRYEWLVIYWLPPQCWPSDQSHFPDDFLRRFLPIYWPLECWYGGAYYA